MQLQYGATDAFDALAYGESHPGTVEFLRNQYDNVAGLITDAGRAFFDRSRQTFEHFNSNAALNFARKVVQKLAGSDISVDRISFLSDLQQLQKATLTMQRWNMANPVIRQRYLDQRLDGYSDTYINIHGTDIGWYHYDYRRAVEGLGWTDKEGHEHWTQFDDELLDGDRRLMLSEQVDIKDTWSIQNALLKFGDDSTDPEGGQL